MFFVQNRDLHRLTLQYAGVNLDVQHTSMEALMSKIAEATTKVIGCKMPKAECEQVRAAAEREGVSVNLWLKRAVREALKREDRAA